MSKTAVDLRNYGWFFDDLPAAKTRVLVLDYDGTVAPFCADRHRAIPYPPIPALLDRIGNECRTRLIVMSGRSAREVAPLLGLNPPPEIWGCNGLERIHPDGRHEEVAVTIEAMQALTEAEDRLDLGDCSNRIEVKLAGIAVHWRGLPPSDSLKIRTEAYKVLEPLACLPDLALAEFEDGVELRLRWANKGDALNTLLSELDSDFPVAYLGDDASDEDAFRVLNGRGLSVLVRPKYRFTAAQMWLRPPEELVEFLKEWNTACGSDLP